MRPLTRDPRFWPLDRHGRGASRRCHRVLNGSRTAIDMITRDRAGSDGLRDGNGRGRRDEVLDHIYVEPLKASDLGSKTPFGALARGWLHGRKRLRKLPDNGP